MAFNSIIFLLAFLPFTLGGYYLLSLSPLHAFRLPFLILMTLLFYGRAQAIYVPLLLGSIIANYLIASMLLRTTKSPATKRAWLTFGVIGNAGALLYLKYFSAVAGAIWSAFGASNPFGDIVAPLAISFYTFQQIGFLVDVARGHASPKNIVHYMAFVAFFPTLLAGPITLHREIAPQLAVRPPRHRIAQNILIGLIIFSLGLFKKTVLADTIALWADPIFNAVHGGANLGMLLAWGAAFTYTFQIYFDFSGYSDMAIGAARMLGIILPLNFFSPLRSTSISEFWRRWHMTLSRFVRTYIYQSLTIPLTRLASDRGYGRWRSMAIAILMPTFLSMLIIGTWHGPNWTFMLFGTMHGAFMCTNEIYHSLTRSKRRGKIDSMLATCLYSLTTFLAFSAAAVPFRSENASDAFRIFGGMIGLNGAGIDENWSTDMSLAGNAMLFPVLTACLLIVYLLPNTEQFMDMARPALEWDRWRQIDPARIKLRFRFTTAWIGVIAVALFLGFAFTSRTTTSFIYFNF